MPPPLVSSRALFAFPLSLEDRRALALTRPAVYLIGNYLGVLYIGQAGGRAGVWGRVAAHLRGDMLRKRRRHPTSLLVLRLRCACALDHVERRLIHALKPILNGARSTSRRRVHSPGLWCLRCTRRERPA